MIDITIRAPMLRGRGLVRGDKELTEMELPAGKTCADCRHCERCCRIFGHIPEDEVCDWHPSRFSPVATPAPQPAQLLDIGTGDAWA